MQGHPACRQDTVFAPHFPSTFLTTHFLPCVLVPLYISPLPFFLARKPYKGNCSPKAYASAAPLESLSLFRYMSASLVLQLLLLPKEASSRATHNSRKSRTGGRGLTSQAVSSSVLRPAKLFFLIGLLLLLFPCVAMYGQSNEKYVTML